MASYLGAEVRGVVSGFVMVIGPTPKIRDNKKGGLVRFEVIKNRLIFELFYSVKSS